MSHCVLVVDDSEDHRFIATTELRRIKAEPAFSIEEAGRGDEALEKIEALLRKHAHLLVLADYRMPRMGGIELVRLARARFPAGEVRYIIYSSTDHGVAAESRAAGAHEFLTKPMDLQQFRAALARIVREWYTRDGGRPPQRSL